MSSGSVRVIGRKQLTPANETQREFSGSIQVES